MHTTGAAKEILEVNFLGQFFKFGGTGVDIFFVLSGFIITYTTQDALKKSSNFMKFFKKRFIRIYPVYWIIITPLIFIGISITFINKTYYDFTLTRILDTYFLLPDHLMVSSVSWTLSYELYFYFLFSLAFLIDKKNYIWSISDLYFENSLYFGLFLYPHI